MAKGQYRTANIYYTRASEDGNPSALNSLGNLTYLGLGTTQDFEKAALLYYKAAGKGHAGAQVNLGHLYKQGLGVDYDPVRAFAWYQMAHIHGNPTAEYYLSQIAVEWTLSPLQIQSAMETWPTLPKLMAEGL